MRTANMRYLLWYRRISTDFAIQTAGVTDLSDLCKSRRAEDFLVKIVRMCVRVSSVASKKHENSLTCHSRGGGNPEGLWRARLDSRLLGNDELFASQSSLAECESVFSKNEG
jgi:hypothetical protein